MLELGIQIHVSGIFASKTKRETLYLTDLEALLVG
jgi:hypothetical protein